MLEILTEKTFQLYEISIGLGIMMLWIVYLIHEKNKVDKKNDKLINALSDLSVTISEVTNNVSNLNGRLVRKIQEHMNNIEKLIIDRIPKK